MKLKEKDNMNKQKHLEFIQAIITRMNSNSFMIKGWAVTLVAALFALAASSTKQGFFLIAYIPVLIFWGLDAYYLSQERQYRALYGDVIAKSENEIDFSLDASGKNNGDNTWNSSCLSKTILWFYLPLVLLMIIVMYLINN